MTRTCSTSVGAATTAAAATGSSAGRRRKRPGFFSAGAAAAGSGSRFSSAAPSRQIVASTASTSRYATALAPTIAYALRPATSAMTGTATRNAASTMVLGPKTRRISKA